MAFAQMLGLRAYSFSFKKWHGKMPEQLVPLNNELKIQRTVDEKVVDYIFPSALDLFKEFINESSEMDDKVDSRQLFRCSFNDANRGETENFRYIVFSVFSGYYGYASELVDRKTRSVVHKKSKNEADVKQFYVMVVIPKDTQLSIARRGLLLFQEIGIYGIKTVTADAMQTFFSQKLGLTIHIQNLAPDFYLKKLFDNGIIQKIKIARNSTSCDSADRLYGAGFGREERTLVPVKITHELKATLKHVSESKYNFFTFDNHDYSEVKMVVKIGDRTRTVNLHGLDELSVEEALPDELLLPDGTIDFSQFESYTLDVAEEYTHHLPNGF